MCFNILFIATSTPWNSLLDTHKPGKNASYVVSLFTRLNRSLVYLLTLHNYSVINTTAIFCSNSQTSSLLEMDGWEMSSSSYILTDISK